MYISRESIIFWGWFLSFLDISGLEEPALKNLDFSYALITNEHNSAWQLDTVNNLFLEPIKVFRYNVNSGTFVTGVYKFRNIQK